MSLPFREDHGLQYIDNLCDVGHFHRSVYLWKTCRGKSGHESVAHRVLLEQMAGDRTGFHIPPSAHSSTMRAIFFLRVVFIHDSDMLFNDILYLKAFSLKVQ